MTEGLVSYACMFERAPPECQPNRRSKKGQIALISGAALEEAIYRSNFQFILWPIQPGCFDRFPSRRIIFSIHPQFGTGPALSASAWIGPLV